MNSTNPYAPPRAHVRDMAGESGTAAGRGARLGAAFLDGLIFMAMVELPLLVAGGLNGAFDAASPNFGRAEAYFGFGGLLSLVGLVIWIWLTVRFVSRDGQSIAKKMLGIKVVRTDGSRASLGRIFWLRNVVNGVLSIIPLYGLIDVLVIFGESRQCVHDRIADTIVVKA
jgi:uncharacterized RDD family membrane protein YckC